MNNETIIVSMTSYPPRIGYAYTALKSILSQNVEKDKFHCVLALAETEFPNREKSLPKDLANLCNSEVELIWYPKNIKSHKKLIPALKKYPNNPILVVDDDVQRPQGWLKEFIHSHEKYPTDIIGGTYAWFFDDKCQLKRFEGFKGKNCGTFNNVENLVILNGRPANGLGGTLYPKGTFVDSRFFNEDLMMKLCPTSDESWQFCFAIMGDKIYRTLGKTYDYSASYISGTQRVKTSLFRQNNYKKIHDGLFNAFPEYKEKLLGRSKKIVVSLTSYKERLKTLPMVIDSILNGTMKPYRIVLTLDDKDVQYIEKESPRLKELIDSNKVTLLVSDKALKPHTKYFFAMQKYKNNPIVTIDDDCVYSNKLLENLYRGYVNNPNCIISSRVHRIKYGSDGKPLKYNLWEYETKKYTEPRLDLFATGVGGVLYPPDILNINDSMVDEIHECINADDVYLKYLELRKGIKTVYVSGNSRKMIQGTQEKALCYTNTRDVAGVDNNDDYIKRFPLYLDKRHYFKRKNGMNKKVIYTCITGGYDTLLTHSKIQDDFDYVCFTDDANLTSDIWEIRPLPKETEGLDNVRKQRYIKVNPHKVLPEYELSIWVDGNVDIKSDLDTLLSEIQQEDTSVYIPRHPVRRCIYDEAVACKRMRKDNSDIIDKQMEAYKKEGMPLKFGLPQSGIIIRKHNDEKCKKLMEAWWQEIKNHSRRDQLSFTYALWKNKDVNVCYLDRNIFKSKYFYWSGVHKHYTANPSSKTETKDPRMSNLKANIESIKKNVSRLKELSPERQRGRAIRFHPW